MSEFLGVNGAMTERKHLFRIRSLNSRKKRIPVVSCLNFFSTAFRTIEISNALPLHLVQNIQ